jgi:hypothetical protein
VVGLWASDQTLLTSTYVTSSDQQIGLWWIFAPITPVPLTAGDYFVGAQGLAPYTTYISGPTVAPQITYVADAEITTGENVLTLTFPDYSNGNGPDLTSFGGNVLLSQLSEVPEPGTLTMLSCGLLGLAGMFRRKLM